MSADTPQPATVKVWDIWTRLFHWIFATAIVLAWLSHEIRDRQHTVHVWLGYLAVSLILARIVWGFVGPRHSRFSDFVKGPVHLARYSWQTLTATAPRHIGHNPLGGIMVLFMMALTLSLGVTGYVMTHRGMNLFGLGHRELEEVHGLLADLFVIAVPLHVAGVIFASLKHRENLVGAMITGRKRAMDG